MNPTPTIWLRRAAMALAVLAIVYFSRDLVAQLTGRTIAFLSFLVSVFFLPAALFVLGWFAYAVFLKKYLRARRIDRIRNARYLKEAVERGDIEGPAEE